MAKNPKQASGPNTLAFDIGGTGLKAALLDPQGELIGERLRVDTPYPCPPRTMLKDLVALVKPLARYDRISVGFPGMVRKGKILTAPHFVTKHGPGSKIDADLVKAWHRFDFAGELEKALGKPVRIANDADLQGAAVVRGEGLEMVVTLGTGVGTALFLDGKLAPHLELAHHPFRKGDSYNEQIGDAALKRIEKKRWNKRVHKAIETLYDLVIYDHLYVGGGNARHVEIDLGPKVTTVDNVAGLLGGIKLWAMANP